MTENGSEGAEARWLVLVVKVPAEPSRHRVAVWRELRKLGALSLGQGVWAVPDLPVFGDGIARALELTERAGGEAMSLAATGRGAQDGQRLREMFTAARSADWAEFLADCGKFEQELAKALGEAGVGHSRIAKFTLAELEEEEQSLERLRRWHRDLTARDVFGAPEAAAAGERLKACVAACADYAERVFAALHQVPEPRTSPDPTSEEGDGR
ncbi:Chromate resistance protein ChrB [Streptomyces sp. HD]|uniref:Chromate resistance protein ChrB n=1 Tax=Streptomyces sp. HD TaxID=3020892 RepID=UPI00232E2A05|nr:Chromate resistance protein ChrB [Streptomyces sp. HD]MDC0767596.1 chromate resistance protein ChrB [Streptomyces sp. HD]